MRRRPVWLGAAVVVALVAFGPGLLDWAWLSWHQRQAGRRLAELQARHRDLVAEQERLTNDALYVEDLARSTLKLAKPGEIVIPLSSSSRQSNR